MKSCLYFTFMRFITFAAFERLKIGCRMVKNLRVLTLILLQVTDSIHFGNICILQSRDGAGAGTESIGAKGTRVSVVDSLTVSISLQFPVSLSITVTAQVVTPV